MTDKAYWKPDTYIKRKTGPDPPAGLGVPLHFYRCSSCQRTANGHRTPFCPWCGAEMHEFFEHEEKGESDNA